MLRVCAASVAAVLAAALLGPAPASAKELKPKFGDIGGVYYTDVAENREACRQAIKNKIALCRQNTSFVSNTLDRKYPGCLPIFRQQAGICVTHFRRQTSKCDVFGSARIDDFTGFACTVTKTVVEEGGEPERGPGIAPMDRRMTARTRVNLRAGPGTDHRVVGSLAAGQAVQATGRAGAWLRIARPGGGTAFVHGDFMVAAAGREQQPQTRSTAAGLSPKCAGMGKGAKCWNELANRPGCYVFEPNYRPGIRVTWSGACAGSVAVGRGTWRWKTSRGSGEGTGALVRGKLHGRWVYRWEGHALEGPYVNGKQHGRWIFRNVRGDVSEGPYVNGKMHGMWIFRNADGNCRASRFSHGKGSSKSTRC